MKNSLAYIVRVKERVQFNTENYIKEEKESENRRQPNYFLLIKKQCQR